MGALTSPFTLSDYRCFPGRPEQCREARRWIRGLVRAFPAVAEAVEVVTSEFFSNALAHTASSRPGGTVDVSLVGLACGVLHLEVIDAGAASGSATVTIPQAHCMGGRGLLLAAALCHEWGRLPADGDLCRGITTPAPRDYTGPMITWAEFQTTTSN